MTPDRQELGNTFRADKPFSEVILTGFCSGSCEQ
jgi:hypothetical protein